MITVKNLGWLGLQHGSTYELDPNYIKDTDQLISYIDLLSKDFKLHLKQMFLNGVTYVVFIDGQPHNIVEILKNAIKLTDSVLIEFVPYFKFNAGYYEGIRPRDLVKEGPLSLIVPFTSHFFSWLRSNPIKLDDNEPYKEVYKKRQEDYKKIIKDLYAPKSKGDFLSENNHISYGEPIPLAYGTVKFSGRNIANSVVTDIVPIMSQSTLTQLEQIYSNSSGMFTQQSQKLGEIPPNWDATISQLKQNYQVELDTSALVRGLNNYKVFLNMFTNNQNLNMLTLVKDPNNTVISYDYTVNLRIDSKSVGKAFLDTFRNFFSSKRHHIPRAEHFYDDEGGAVLFFYMYKDLVEETEKKFKELITSVGTNENELKRILSNNNKFNTYKSTVNYLSSLTASIFRYAKSVYNFADAANGQGGHLGMITNIMQILLKVFGEDYVKQYLQKSEIRTWYIVTHGGINYVNIHSALNYQNIQNTNGTGNLRGELFDYIDRLIKLKI